VLHFAAAEGEMGGAGEARSEREGGTEPGDPKESSSRARESTAQNRSGQVLC